MKTNEKHLLTQKTSMMKTVKIFYVFFICIYCFAFNSKAQFTFPPAPFEDIYKHSDYSLHMADVISIPFGKLGATGKIYFKDDFTTGNYPMFISKTDEQGLPEWIKCYHAECELYPTTIASTSDKGLLVGGSTGWCDPMEFNMFLLKVDSSGTQQWLKYYNNGNYSEVKEVFEDNDGNFVGIGQSNINDYGGSAATVFKTDPQGNLIGVESYNLGDDAWVEGLRIQPFEEDSYIALMQVHSFIDFAVNPVVLKLDNQLQLDWNRFINTYNKNICGADLQEGAHGHIYVTGMIHSDEPIKEVFLINLKPDGDLHWNNTFFWENCEMNTNYDLDVVGLEIGHKGDVYIGGNTQMLYTPIVMPVQSEDMFVIKTNAYGLPQWSNFYGQGNYDMMADMTAEIEQDLLTFGSNGEYNNYTEGGLTRIDDKGDNDCNYYDLLLKSSNRKYELNIIGIENPENDFSNSLMSIESLDADKQLERCGDEIIIIDSVDIDPILPLQINEDLMLEEEKRPEGHSVLSPNPSFGDFSIHFAAEIYHLEKQVTIVDLQGRIVYDKMILFGQPKINFKDYAKGIYFVKIKADTHQEQLKMVIN